MKAFLTRLFLCTLAAISIAAAQNATINISVAVTGVDGDNTAFLYGGTQRLIINDGTAAGGGFRTYALINNAPFPLLTHPKSGRSKVALPVHNVGGRDLIFNIPAPDSLIRLYDDETDELVRSNDRVMLGDWSTACLWQSPLSGENYVFIFGKKVVAQMLVRVNEKKHKSDAEIQILEVQTFGIPIEAESCAAFSNGQIFFSAEDQPLYSFQATESLIVPTVKTVSEDIEVTGLAVYVSNSETYLFIAHDEVIEVYNSEFVPKGSISLTGMSGLSMKGGLSILQSSSNNRPSGTLAFAYEEEEDDDISGIAIGSLEAVLEPLGIEPRTDYTPRDKLCQNCTSPYHKTCSTNGLFEINPATNIGGDHQCHCLPGFQGDDCSRIQCLNDCSGTQGTCKGPNQCSCAWRWTGPDCSWVAVEAKHETEVSEGDGDDPAIWVHPTAPDQSKIITTTKSKEGAGFNVYNLRGKLLQSKTLPQPNNVDVIYKFPLNNSYNGMQHVDLAFAACRGTNTMCFSMINSDGLLEDVQGMYQALPEDYEPYGSCTYQSQKTGRVYLFVNNKEAQYLQYELTSTYNGTLVTTLVRQFQGGSGGQTEGCVGDDQAGYVFIGEEPSGIWRYDAEPSSNATGVQIARVGTSPTGPQADIEGLALIPARNGSGGYLIASSQGISGFAVWERQPPHKYIGIFKVLDNNHHFFKKERKKYVDRVLKVDGTAPETRFVDKVSNTDGVAAVGNPLNGDFGYGLIVVHDDANENADGSTTEGASFKLISVLDVFGPAWSKALGY